MNMFNISFYGKASLIMDGAALFILAGMMTYTSLYRRRGKPEDKIFFALILTNAAAAVFSGIVYILDGFGIPTASGVYRVCFSGLFLAADAFSILFCAYHMHRMEWDKGKINRTLPVLLVPELMLVIMLLAGVLTDNLYTGSIVLGGIELYVFNILDLAPVIICGIFAVCISLKRSRQMSLLILLLFAAHILLTATCVTNVTPLFMTIYLMFSHLVSMRDSFYEEAVE